MVDPVEVFYSYARADEKLRNELEKQLSMMKRMGIISSWHDRNIEAGTTWEKQIDSHLNDARVILLLISSDFIASAYCYDIEMKTALKRQEEGSARVIPIILRPVDWSGSPFAHLQALPTDGKPVTEWQSVDAALLDVAQGIRRAVESMHRDS